jgi:hypothetical protein
MTSVPVGDLDGDGRSDYALTPIFDQIVFLYLNNDFASDPASALLGPRDAGAISNDFFGYGVGVSDLNGDGYGDLLVSASGAYVETWTTPDFPYNTGRLYVYPGGPAGVGMNPIWFDRARPSDFNDNPQSLAYRFASTGDLNGDGFDDVAVVDPSRRQICYVYGSEMPVVAHLDGCAGYPGWLVEVK